MSSSSPPDPWREPRDPGAAPSIWDRYAEQAGGQAGPAPRGLDPGRPQERSQSPQQDRDSRPPWGAEKPEWEPRTAEWESQPTWAQPPGWGQRQGDPPPPGQHPADPYQPGGRPPAPGAPDPYQPDPNQQGPYQPGPYQQGGYQQGGYQEGGYPGDPYARDPYQAEAPPNDPYAMWGEPWEEQAGSGLTAAPPRRRRRWPLVLLATVTAVILVVVLVPGVRELISPPGFGPAAAQAVTLGEAGRDGSLEFTAQAVDCRVSTLDGTDITTDGVFCAVHLRVANTGEEPIALDPAAQRLFDQNDQPFTVNEAWLALGTRSFVQEIAAGVTANGVLVFEAPAGIQPSRLELHAAADTEGVTVEVADG